MGVMAKLPEGRQPLLWKDMPFAERPKAHPSTERLEIEKLQEEIRILTTAGIAEVAARNSNVMEYMSHWESRTEKAEARVTELEAVLKIISDMPHSDTCSKELTFMAHGCDCHVDEARAALKEKNK